MTIRSTTMDAETTRGGRDRALLRTRTGLAALVAGCLVSAGCGKKDEPPATQAPTTATSAAPSAPTQAEADAGTPPKGPESGEPRRDVEPSGVAAPAGPVTGLFAAPQVARLPKSMFGLVVATPKKLIDGLGLDKVIADYATSIGPTALEMEEALGKNLFDLASWKSIGIDLDGPAGVGAPDVEREGFIAFATLADPAALRSFLDALAKKTGAPVQETKAGEATILTVGDQDRGALVIAGNQLFLVSMMRGNGAAAMAQEIAQAKPEAGLGQSPSFLAAAGGVANDEAAGYVDLGVIVRLTERSKRPAFANDFDRQIQAAKDAGDQARVAQLEADLAEYRRMMQRVEERERAEKELTKSLLGDLQGMAVGLDVSPEAVEATLHLPLAQGSIIRTLVSNTSGAFSIVKATKGTPLFLAAARLDLPAYMALIDKMAKAGGSDLAEARAQLKEIAGLDFDKDVLGLFNGEVGVGITGDAKAIMAAASDEPWNLLSGGMAIGLSNPDGMKALLAKAGGMAQLARFVRFDAASSVLTVPLPIDKALSISVAGNHLVISVDPDLGARLASGDASASFVGSVDNPKLKALLERPDQAGLYYMPVTLSAGWLMMRAGGSYRMPPPADPGMGDKYDAYVKLSKEIEDLEAAEEAKEMEAVMAVLDKIGVTAEVLEVKPDGLSATFGQYVKGATVPEVVGSLVALLTMARNPTENPDLRTKREERAKLEAELHGVREMKAIEAAPVEPPAPQPTP